MLPIAGCVVGWWKSLKFREVGGSAIAFASTRASKANVYVIRFLAVLCLCNDGTFSRLRFSAAEFCQPDGNRTRPDTSPPQHPPLGRRHTPPATSPHASHDSGHNTPTESARRNPPLPPPRPLC